MRTLSRQSTIHFEPDTFNALKIKSELSNLSVSEIVDEAVRLLMAEDIQDLSTFEERQGEKEIGHAALLSNLKQYGKM